MNSSSAAGKRTAFWALGVIVLAMGVTQLTRQADTPVLEKLESTDYQPGDTVQIHSYYLYRYLGAEYDSVTVSCMYGEFCIPSQDSLVVEYRNLVTEGPVNGSRDSINALSRTKAVTLSMSDTISFYRNMGLSNGWYQPGMDTNFPDTLVWTLRMYDAATDEYLYTLDSIGMRREMGPDFPAYFGTGNTNTWGIVTVSLLNFAALATVDSVYFRMSMESTDSYPTNFFMFESESLNYKYSDEMSQPKAATRPGHLDNSVLLKAFPNPFREQVFIDLSTKGDQSRSVSVYLYAMDGRLLSKLYQGELRSTIRRIVYNPTATLPSASYRIVVKDEASGKILDKLNLVRTK